MNDFKKDGNIINNKIESFSKLHGFLNNVQVPSLKKIRSEYGPKEKEKELITNIPDPAVIDYSYAAAGTRWISGAIMPKESVQLQTSMTVGPYPNLYSDDDSANSLGSESWVFLTATNRAKMCCEVVNIYHPYSPDAFGVFDWGRQDEPGPRWMFTINYTDMLKNTPWYFAKKTWLDNKPRYWLKYWSKTEEHYGNWLNQILLWDFHAQCWDIIYEYIMPGTLTHDQVIGSDSVDHWWGPIVEVFEQPAPDIKPLGFYHTQIRYDYGKWNLVTSSQALQIAPVYKITQNYITPWHSFIASGISYTGN